MKLRKVAAITIAAAVMATMSVTAFAEGEGTPAEAVWVGAESGGTAELNKWISFEKLGGALNKPCLLLCSEDDAAEPPADSELSFKVSDVYGFVFYAEFDKTTWDNWHGGQIGTNSALGGWNAFIDYSTGNEVEGLTIDIDAGTIKYLGNKALFDQAEQDQGGYAHIWLMDWSNGDDAVKVCGMDILDKDGNVMTFDTPAVGAEEEVDEAEDEIEEEPEEEIEEETEDEIEEEPEEEVEEEIAEEEEEAPAPATGDVDAATDSSKGSPDTGVADVAAFAGIGVLAAGAAIVAKKRK